MGMLLGGYHGKPKKVSRETFIRVVGLFKPYGLQVWQTVGLVLISAAVGLLPPFFLQTIINQGLLKKDFGVVTRMSLETLLAVVVATGTALGFGYVSTLIGQRIMRDLRNDLYGHLQGMSLRFFTGTRTGEIQSRLANDVGGIQSVVSDTAANVLNNLTVVLSTLVAMFILDWRLSLLSVGILPVFAFVAFKVGSYLRKWRGTSQAQMADLNSTMNETLSVSGILLTKTSGRQTMSLRKFVEQNDKMTDTNVRINMMMRVFFNLIGLTFQLTPILVYWLAGWLGSGPTGGALTIGTIVAFTSLQGRLFFPLTGLLNIQVEVGSAMALFDRIFEYLDLKQDIVDAPNALALSPNEIAGRVEFRDVVFRYEPTQEHPSLDRVNIDAEQGQLVALVGASGAGKTTLTYLIPRLYDVDEGAVLIDGHDVRAISLESLGRSIAVVTQET
jgi:ATP-binding cassette subfamily B protein